MLIRTWATRSLHTVCYSERNELVFHLSPELIAMANPEHLEILKQGAMVWNDWRREHCEIKPNFSGAVIPRIDLMEVNFSDADLSGADLIYANLSGANLVNANLNRAVLVYATLSSTRLTGARFDHAELAYTIFANIDLREAVGLENIKHAAPSEVSISTIYLSQGRIPEVFLRGCGLPDEFITYMHSLVTNPIQFYSCFISYSSKNQLFADRLYADLQNKGVRCWLASEDLKIGAKTRIAIDESIRIHDKLLLVLSKHSVASHWVEQEVETALHRERKEKRTILFPIRLDDTVMKIDTGWPALIRNTRNIGDFSKWGNPEAYRKALDRLLRDLKADK